MRIFIHKIWIPGSFGLALAICLSIGTHSVAAAEEKKANKTVKLDCNGHQGPHNEFSQSIGKAREFCEKQIKAYEDTSGKLMDFAAKLIDENSRASGPDLAAAQDSAELLAVAKKSASTAATNLRDLAAKAAKDAKTMEDGKKNSATSIRALEKSASELLSAKNKLHADLFKRDQQLAKEKNQLAAKPDATLASRISSAEQILQKEKARLKLMEEAIPQFARAKKDHEKVYMAQEALGKHLRQSEANAKNQQKNAEGIVAKLDAIKLDSAGGVIKGSGDAAEPRAKSKDDLIQPVAGEKPGLWERLTTTDPVSPEMRAREKAVSDAVWRDETASTLSAEKSSNDRVGKYEVDEDFASERKMRERLEALTRDPFVSDETYGGVSRDLLTSGKIQPSYDDSALLSPEEKVLAQTRGLTQQSLNELDAEAKRLGGTAGLVARTDEVAEKLQDYRKRIETAHRTDIPDIVEARNAYLDDVCKKELAVCHAVVTDGGVARKVNHQEIMRVSYSQDPAINPDAMPNKTRSVTLANTDRWDGKPTVGEEHFRYRYEDGSSNLAAKADDPAYRAELEKQFDDRKARLKGNLSEATEEATGLTRLRDYEEARQQRQENSGRVAAQEGASAVDAELSRFTAQQPLATSIVEQTTKVEATREALSDAQQRSRDAEGAMDVLLLPAGAPNLARAQAALNIAEVNQDLSFGSEKAATIVAEARTARNLEAAGTIAGVAALPAGGSAIAQSAKFVKNTAAEHALSASAGVTRMGSRAVAEVAESATPVFIRAADDVAESAAPARSLVANDNSPEPQAVLPRKVEPNSVTSNVANDLPDVGAPVVRQSPSRQIEDAISAANDNFAEETFYRQAERAERLDPTAPPAGATDPWFVPPENAAPPLRTAQDRADSSSLGGGRLGQGARLGEAARAIETPTQNLSVLSRSDDWRVPTPEAPPSRAALSENVTPARAETERTAEAPRVSDPPPPRPQLDSYVQEKITREAANKIYSAKPKEMFEDIVATSPTNRAEVKEAFIAAARNRNIPESEISRMRSQGAVENIEEALTAHRAMTEKAVADKIMVEQRNARIQEFQAQRAGVPEPEYVLPGPSAKWANKNDATPFSSVAQRVEAENYVRQHLGVDRLRELQREAGVLNRQKELKEVVSVDSNYKIETTVQTAQRLPTNSNELRNAYGNFRPNLTLYEKNLAQAVRETEVARSSAPASKAPSVASAPAAKPSYSTAAIQSPVPPLQRQALRDKNGVPDYLTSVAHEDVRDVRMVVYQQEANNYAEELGSKARTNWDYNELTKRQQAAWRDLEPKVEKFQSELRAAEEQLAMAANKPDQPVLPASERPSLIGRSKLPSSTPDMETVAKSLDGQGVRYQTLDENRLVIQPDNTTTLGKTAKKMEQEYGGEVIVDSRLANRNVAASGGIDTIRVNPNLITDPKLQARLEPTVNHEFRHVKNSNSLADHANAEKFNWEQTTFGDGNKPTGIPGYDLMGIDEVTASRQSFNTARFEAAAAKRSGNSVAAEAKTTVADFSFKNTESFTGAALDFTRQAEKNLVGLEGKPLVSAVTQKNPVLAVREIQATDGTPATVRVETRTFRDGRVRTDLVVDVKNPAGEIVPMRMPVPSSVAKLSNEEVVKRAKDYVTETGKKLEVHQNLLAQRAATRSPNPSAASSRAPAALVDDPSMIGIRADGPATSFSRGALQEMANRRVNWVLKEHSEFSAIKAADNRSFMDLAARAERGQAKESFFVTENAVLKRLNDEVVKDKDFVTALDNLHKDVLLREIKNDPVLKDVVVASYNDYKSIGFALKRNDPQIRRLLDEKIAKTNEGFNEFLKKVETAKGWKEKSIGLANDMRTWHHSGIGNTFQEAGLAARRSREIALESGQARLVNFSDQSAHYSAATDRLAARSDEFAEKFKNAPFVEKTPHGTALSEEAIETIRKAKPLGRSEADMDKAVQAAIGRRYGQEISAEEASLLRSQLKDIDSVNPSLLIEKRVEINMGLHDEGLVSFDFKGQNSRNLYQTQMAMLKTKGQDMKTRLQAIAEGDRIATAKLDDMKARVEKAVASLGEKYVGKDVSKVIQKSGDDGIFHPLAPLGPAEKAKLAEALQEQNVADAVRLTYLPKNYRNSDELIPVAERNRLVGEAEKIEKDLFTEHLVGKLPDDVFKGLDVKVDLLPAKDGRSAVGISFGHVSGKPIPAKAEEIVRSVLKDKYDIISVDRTPAPFSPTNLLSKRAGSPSASSPAAAASGSSSNPKQGYFAKKLDSVRNFFSPPKPTRAQKKLAEDLVRKLTPQELDPNRTMALQKEIDLLRKESAKGRSRLEKLANKKVTDSDVDAGLRETILATSKEVAEVNKKLLDKVGLVNNEVVLIKEGADNSGAYIPPHYALRSTKPDGFTASRALSQLSKNSGGTIKLEVNPYELAKRKAAGTAAEGGRNRSIVISLPEPITKSLVLENNNTVLHEGGHAWRNVKKSASIPEEASGSIYETMGTDRAREIHFSADQKAKREWYVSNLNKFAKENKLSAKQLEESIAKLDKELSDLAENIDNFKPVDRSGRAVSAKLDESLSAFHADPDKKMTTFKGYEDYLQFDELQTHRIDARHYQLLEEQKEFISRTLGKDAVPESLSQDLSFYKKWKAKGTLKKATAAENYLTETKQKLSAFHMSSKWPAGATFKNSAEDTVSVFKADEAVKVTLPIYENGKKVGTYQTIIKDVAFDNNQEVLAKINAKLDEAIETARASRADAEAVLAGRENPLFARAERTSTPDLGAEVLASKADSRAQRLFREDFSKGKFDNTELTPESRVIVFQNEATGRTTPGRVMGTSAEGLPVVKLANGSERVLQPAEMATAARADARTGRSLDKLEKYTQEFKSRDLEKIAPSLETSEYLHRNGYREWATLGIKDDQGTKMHLGLAPEAISRHAAKLTAKLREMNIPHIIDADFDRYLNNALTGDQQAGKFITLFPRNDAEALAAATEMKKLYKELGIKADDTLNPPGEYLVAPGISARYGAFTNKNNGKLIDPNGIPVADTRGAGFGPEWAKTPFARSEGSVAKPTVAAGAAGGISRARTTQIAANTTFRGSLRQDINPESEENNSQAGAPNQSRASEIAEKDDEEFDDSLTRTPDKAAVPKTKRSSQADQKSPDDRQLATPRRKKTQPVEGPQGPPAPAPPAAPTRKNSPPGQTTPASAGWSPSTGAIVGVAAVGAVGAGALILANQKKDKAAGGSGSPEGKTGKQLQLSGLVERIKIGEELKPLEISEPANGTPLPDGTEVTVACVEPTPCSLNGELKAVSAEGKISFPGLKFTSAHTKAILEFTAAGFEKLRAPALMIEP